MSKAGTENKKREVRWEIFIPALGLLFTAMIIGVVNNEWLRVTVRGIFAASMDNFGWLFQLTVMAATILTAVALFTKVGNIRLGGRNAKPKYSFKAWFAMSLTAGIAVGIVNWGINEPIIMFGSVWGELAYTGITPHTREAAYFAMGTAFYHWTIVPYATYAICGLLSAYLYFNKKKELTITGTLEPVLGEKIAGMRVTSAVVNVLCVLAIIMGMAGGLGTGINFVFQGLYLQYGVNITTTLWVVFGVLIVAGFTTSSFLGIDKGVKNLAQINKYIFYVLVLIIAVLGPTRDMLNFMVEGIGSFSSNFFEWGFDPGTQRGEALSHWWSLFNWAMWIAYAPIMGLFLARVAYGRTIRQFLIVNWVLPSIFGMVWFSVFGGAALSWQMNGVVDIYTTIVNHGAVAGAWTFFQNLPFGLATIVIPIIMFVLIVSFVTAADSMTNTVASLCVKGAELGEEPPAYQKLLWGISIGGMAVILGAVGGGSRGIDGVRQLAAVGGFLATFVFALQIISFFKVFIMSKLTDNFDAIGDQYTEEELAELEHKSAFEQ